MQSKTQEQLEDLDPLSFVVRTLADSSGDSEQLSEARNRLLNVAESARDADRPDLSDGATMLADLLDIVQCSQGQSDSDFGGDFGGLPSFLISGVTTLRAALNEEVEAALGIEKAMSEARERWGDYLSLLGDGSDSATKPGTTDWDLAESLNKSQQNDDGDLDDRDGDSDTGATAAADVNTILSSLGSLGTQPKADSASTAPQAAGTNSPPQASHTSTNSAVGNASPAPVEAKPSSASEAGKTEFVPENVQAIAAAVPKDHPFANTGQKENTDSANLPSPPSPIVDPDIEEELLEAYLEDAVRCLAEMEQAVLTFENEPENKECLQQLCRELHTVKGASASVGLTDLAGYLHQVEDYVQAGTKTDDAVVDVEPLLECVDTIRTQIEVFTSPQQQPEADAPSDATGAPEKKATKAFTAGLDSSGPDSEDSLRVKASALDRLMDLLAELVLLRNRRDTRVMQLQQIHSELLRCVTRLRGGPYAFSGSLSNSLEARRLGSGSSSGRPSIPTSPNGSRRSNPLSEIGNDLSELTRSLREVYEPISEENVAISRTVAQFRQELMELRRVPVSGLFRRLQRAASDAARIEGKRVRLELIGEDAGMERSLQERLFEPLLHIVRNAVSHGIESESERTAAGKDSVGTITLEARGGPGALVFEVRDDGKGLDYDAIRRRAIETGLLAGDRPASQAELARLIFHAGFSTRETANAVSGRGVGMDVVASTLDRMRSKVDVDSKPGQGTTIRLTIPLRSVIEHAMIFRVDGQLFALPMQFAQAAKNLDRKSSGTSSNLQKSYGSQTENLPTFRVRDLLSLRQTPLQSREQMLIVRHGRFAPPDGAQSGEGSRSAAVPTTGADHRIALLVDEILGPDEVVVRSLPPLTRKHRLFSGATLSGSGEVALLFEHQRLIELARNQSETPTGNDLGEDQTSQISPPETERPTVIVADDSLSTRRVMVQLLKRWGFDVVEASDGMEAMEILRGQDLPLVLTDLEMPRMDGFELLAEIKSGYRSKSTRVVMVTSCSGPEVEGRAQELGADGYLHKPVSERALGELLKEFGLNPKCD